MADTIYLKTGQFSANSLTPSKNDLQRAMNVLKDLDLYGEMSDAGYVCNGRRQRIFTTEIIDEVCSLAILIETLGEKLDAYSELLRSAPERIRNVDSSFKGSYTTAWQRSWYSISSGVSSVANTTICFWGSLFRKGGQKTGEKTTVVDEEKSPCAVDTNESPEQIFDNTDIESHDYSEDWGENQRGSVRYVYQLGDYGRNGWTVYDADGKAHSDYHGKSPEQAGFECGYAAQSMAVSFLGINKSPGELCEGEYGKVRGERPWKSGTNYASSYDISSVSCVDGSGGYHGQAAAGAIVAKRMTDSFLRDHEGTLSPVVIHYGSPNATNMMHAIMIIGKTPEGKYLALDPAKGNQKVTFSIADDGTVEGDITYPGCKIDAVQQYVLTA